MNVKFDEQKLVSIKPATIVNTIEISTLEREEYKIENCETEEDIKKLKEKLIKETQELERKKLLGFDIYQKYQDLCYKIDRLNEVHRKLIQKMKSLLALPSHQCLSSQINQFHNKNLTLMIGETCEKMQTIEQTKL